MLTCSSQKRLDEQELQDLQREHEQLLERHQVAAQEEEQLREELEQLRLQEAREDQQLSVSFRSYVALRKGHIFTTHTDLSCYIEFYAGKGLGPYDECIGCSCSTTFHSHDGCA